MKRKLNKKNVMILSLYILSIALIASDFLTITISTFMGKTAGWTWFGFVTFMASWVILDWTYNELVQILNKKKENR